MSSGMCDVPAAILPAHLADQMSDLMRNDGSAGLAAAHERGIESRAATNDLRISFGENYEGKGKRPALRTVQDFREAQSA